MDASHTAVALPTDGFGLPDEVMIDRLLPYEFPEPGAEVLLEVARGKARAQKLGEDDPAPRIRSIREAERLATRACIAKVIQAAAITWAARPIP